MKKYTPDLYGDKERWKKALDVIRAKSKTKGDNLDVLFLEKMINKEPFPKYTLEEKLEQDKQIRRYKAHLQDSQKLYKKLLAEYEKLDSLYNAALAFDKIKIPEPIIKEKSTGKSQAIAFAQWSDWHVGEIVTKAQTHGLNEYNPNVAKKRVKTLYNNLISLIRKEQQFSKIDTLVVHLGGDFMNGWIHLENRETNSMSPIEEIKFATELICEALLAVRPEVKKLIVVCNVGNHGRFTEKYRYSNEIQTSFETLLYSNIAAKISNDIEMIPPTGSIMYHKFFDQVCRFFHGHQVRYINGVGGISIPLNKKQDKWNRTVNANFNFMGHYHTCSMPNTSTVLNGSLVGYNSFAVNYGFSYEPAQQSFLLFHEKYKWTAFHSVLAE